MRALDDQELPSSTSTEEGLQVPELPSSRPGGWDDPSAPSIPAPLRLHRTKVSDAWVDYNGHMTESAYLLAMGDGSDAFFRYIGINDAYRAGGSSLYTVETHIRNLAEASAGDELELTLRILGSDAKRIHLTHEVLRIQGTDSQIIATGEQMLLHVTGSASSPLPQTLRERVVAIARAHQQIPVPDWVGRVMGLPKRSS